MTERPHIQILKTRALEPRKFIQVVTGPRQVGKTTMIRQLLNQISVRSIYESADALPANYSVWLEQIWENARLTIKTQLCTDFLLVIDEVQKISNWSETVKKLWDEDTINHVPLKVILLGSSRLLIQQGLTESLAGRFETTYMAHWSYKEMHDAFGWNADQYAWFGSYPGSAELIHDEPRWKKYISDSLIETSISKDILMLTRIDKPALLKNLFELGSQYSGQILSYTKIQGQLQDAGNTTTLSHYLQLLSSAGLLSGIEKFSGSTLKKRSSSPKFQVHNNALLCALSYKLFHEVASESEHWGRIVESAIGAHLLNQTVHSNINLYYWRERDNEVDFVLEKDNKVIAIEVKSSVGKSVNGMSEFIKRFNPARTYLVDNRSLSWSDFLQIHPGELF